MAKIVSEKTWLKLDRGEIHTIVSNILLEKGVLRPFEVTEVQAKNTAGGHVVDELTVGIKYTGPLDDGPLTCGECGRNDFDDEDEVLIHEQTCIGPK